MNQQQKKYEQMVNTPIAKLIITLSIPTILSQLVSTAYNMADSYFVAQLGTSVTAAVGVVNSLQSLIQALGYGIGMGAGTLIARRLGQKRADEANILAATSLVMALAAGLVLVLLGMPNLKGFMKLLGATDTMLPYCVEYGRIILLAAPVMCLSFVSTCLIRFQGAVTQATFGICIGAVLNACMDPIYIFVFKMGVAGAALSTAVAESISALIMFGFLFSKKTLTTLKFTYISKEKQTYLEIIKCGLPTIFRQMMGSFSSALLNNCAKPFGDAAVAAVTISNKIYMLVRQVVLGVGQAFQPVAGYCFGAKRMDRVKSSFNFAVLYGTVVCLIFGGYLWVDGETVVELFAKGDMDVLRMGVEGLKYCCLVLPFLSFSTFVNQMFQVLGFAKSASFLASCRQGICFAPVVLILPLFFGVNGVEGAQAASDLLTFIICIPFQVWMYHYLDSQIVVQ